MQCRIFKMTGICGQRGFKFSVFNFQIAINHPDGFEEVNVSHLCLCIYRISLSLYLPMTIKSLSASAQYCCRRFVPVEKHKHSLSSDYALEIRNAGRFPRNDNCSSRRQLDVVNFLNSFWCV